MLNKHLKLLSFIAFGLFLFIPITCSAAIAVTVKTDPVKFVYGGSCNTHNLTSHEVSDPEGLVVQSNIVKLSTITRDTSSNKSNNYSLSTKLTNLSPYASSPYVNGIVGVNYPTFSYTGYNANANAGNSFYPIGLSTNSPAIFIQSNKGLLCNEPAGIGYSGIGYSAWKQTYYSHDFVFEPNFGWVLLCGHVTSKPVKFSLSMNSDEVPYGANANGYWIISADNPTTVSSKNISTYTTINNFWFDYKGTSEKPNTTLFSNGYSNVIYAYYVEPNYSLTTTASNTATGAKNVNVGSPVHFDLSSGVDNKYNIHNTFSYTNTVSEYIVQNGTTHSRNIGSNTKIVPTQANNPAKTIPNIWSGPYNISALGGTFTDDSGKVYSLKTGDQFCFKIVASPTITDSYRPSDSTSTSCVNVVVPMNGSANISCNNSDIYTDDSSSNFSLSYTVANNFDSTMIIPSVYSVSQSVSGGLTFINISQPGNITSGSSGSGVVNYNTLPIVPNKYTVTLTLTGPGFNTTATCTIHKVIRPYFKVYGGSIMTGSGFKKNDGSCLDSTSSNLVSYKGSSTDQAIFSSGYVYGMGSQNNSTGLNILTFANNLVGISNVLGGSFDGIQCVPDYFLQFKSAGVTVNPNVNFNTPSTVSSPKNYIFDNGDIYINSEIKLATTISNPSLLPVEYIVVKGHDVYINNSVTELDAIIIAQPTYDSNGKAIGGNIYTCSNPTDKTDFGPNSTGTCNNPLTIKGALIANKVFLRRATISANNSASNAITSSSGCEISFKGAEQICFSPLFWLSKPDGVVTSSTSNTDYVLQLPPTL